MSHSRNSRHFCGNVSFSLIAKMAPGQVICLALNLDENDALREASPGGAGDVLHAGQCDAGGFFWY